MTELSAQGPSVPWWSRPAGLWLAISVALGVAAVVAFQLDSDWLDWQPDAARTQVWRWWSAALVHFSLLHLLANLLATALVAAYGWAARVPREVALAWLV
ncbi:MAG: rhomboid family intramembrane serine protease, partial [Rubrivivax sp.]